MPELVVGVGGASAGLPGTDVVLPIRPEHPSAHGAMRLRLRLEDDVIVAAEPEIGYLHRWCGEAVRGT